MTYEQNYIAITGDGGLVHYGVPKMKWGVRRYQNEDGSLTEEGKKHYGVNEGGNQRLGKRYYSQIKKLKRLDDKANITLQKSRADKLNAQAKREAKVGASIGLAGAGVAAGLYGLAKNATASGKDAGHLKKVYSELATEREKRHGLIKQHYGVNDQWISDMSDSSYRSPGELRAVSNIYGDLEKEKLAYQSAALKARTVVGQLAGVISGGILLKAGVDKARASVAKHRTTAVGHAKAVAARKELYDQMRNTYKNTKYAKILEDQNEKIKNAR